MPDIERDEMREWISTFIREHGREPKLAEIKDEYRRRSDSMRSLSSSVSRARRT